MNFDICQQVNNLKKFFLSFDQISMLVFVVECDVPV